MLSTPVFNILDLHLVNDVPGRLIQLRRALSPDGLFMACLFAGQTLNELRQSWLGSRRPCDRRRLAARRSDD